MGPRGPRHAFFLVLLALIPVLGSTDVLDHLRTRRLCENLDAQHAAGKGVPYNFHEEWAQYDCNFWATRDASGAETGTYVYRYLAYAALVQRMRALADVYPALVRLRTAQARYDLPTAGVCPGDAKGVEKTGCRVWILELGSEADAAEKPQVLLSGALHGNERIGPTTLVELATFLLGRYTTDPWARRLLDTRTIVIVPAANAIGYHLNRRDELGVDPNRDFAFDTSPVSCMRTVAARALNEIWRSHVFSFALTFHGGDNLLAFPWGDTAHCPGFPHKCEGASSSDAPFGGPRPRWISPDHTAMAQLAKFSADYAGPEPSSKQVCVRVHILVRKHFIVLRCRCQARALI
jgi:hypothetical protein